MTTYHNPVLYSFRRCPYAMRARLALTVSGTQCELREVTLPAKPSSMLAASPKGTVPVLVLPSGAVLDESLDIMRWALADHDPEKWLVHDDPELIAANDGSFKQALDRYKYPERYAVDALVHRALGLGFLQALDARAAEYGQLCGFTPGLADAAIMPFVRQFAAVDPTWFAKQPLPHLRVWLDDHLGSDLFNAIMIRNARWAPGDLPVFLPRLQERAHPPGGSASSGRYSLAEQPFDTGEGAFRGDQ